MMSFFPSRFRSETETEFGWPPTGRWIAGRKEIPAPGWGAAQLSATRRRKRRVLNTQRLIQEPDQRQHLLVDLNDLPHHFRRIAALLLPLDPGEELLIFQPFNHGVIGAIAERIPLEFFTLQAAELPLE